MALSFFDDVSATSGSNKSEESVLDRIRSAASQAPLFTPEEEVELTEEDIENDPEVIAAKEAAAEIKRIAAEAEAAMAETRIALHTFDAEEAELERQFEALRNKQREIHRKKQEITYATLDKRKAMNEALRAAEDAARSIEVTKQNVSTRVRMSRTVEAYTRIAEKFSWFTGVTMPDGKVIKCLPHQWEGAKFLATAGRAILGDEMGLGKTLTAIGSLDLIGSKRALIITPAEVTSNFLREVKRWAPHRKVVNIKGMTKKERNLALEYAAAFSPLVVIVNYEAWRKDLSLLERLIELQFDTVIADEAHNVKGTNTDAFSGVAKVSLADNVCPLCGDTMIPRALGGRWCEKDKYTSGQSLYSIRPDLSDSERQLLTRSVKNLWMMTGTPILNAPQDLYPMLYLIDPILFPDKSGYLRRYCVMGHDGKYVFAPGGLDALMRRLSGKYLARKKKDAGVILPPQEVIIHTIDFDDETYLMQQDIIKQLTQYHQIVLAEDNKMNTMGVLSLITRQRQANVWPAAIQIWEHPRDEFGLEIKDEPKIKIFDAAEVRESIKIDKVIDLIMEYGVIEGQRIAVFSQFATALEELQKRIESLGLRSVRYDGSTPSKLKDEIKVNWDRLSGEDAKWEIILCNYKTGGVGLNLTAATHTIILDEEWNPGKRDQAYGRTDRMGQTEENFVHVIRVSHTIDTWLQKLIEHKENMIAGFDEATVDIQKELVKAIREGEING